MKTKNLRIFSGSESIVVKNVREVEGINIFRGLMFSSKDNSNALLFNIKSGLHSLFVFYDFLVLWLDYKNKIVDFRIVKPFRFYINTDKEYSKILEVPISRRYSGIANFIVGEKFKNRFILL
ncbi:MAG: hypothetical protein QXI33_01905 [Candidatus Pacearchaeota archaeon]